jgi:hypothetical protein
MAFEEFASRRIVAIALFGDRQADDPDPRIAHRRDETRRILRRDHERAKRADNPNILTIRSSDGERIKPILGLKRIRGLRGAQTGPADRPIPFAARKPVVENDRLMGAMEGADAEMDDADAERVEIVSRPRHVGRQQAERCFAQVLHVFVSVISSTGESVAKLVPSRSPKQNQAQPNKSKQKCLDLFGFIRPNRDFSMGYGDSK